MICDLVRLSACSFVVSVLVQIFEQVEPGRWLGLRVSVAAFIPIKCVVGVVSFWSQVHLLPPESVGLTMRERENVFRSRDPIESVLFRHY